MQVRSILAVVALLAAAHAASAQNPMLDALKNKLGGASAASDAGAANHAGGIGAAGSALASGMGLALPAMGTSTLGNAAGVLQYCIKNNYLSADAAGGIKDKLLGMVTGNKAQQTGFANGNKGLLQGTNGGSFNLKNVGGQLKTKACDYVLDNAKSLI